MITVMKVYDYNYNDDYCWVLTQQACSITLL